MTPEKPQLVLFLYETPGKYGWSAELPNGEVLGVAAVEDVQYGLVDAAICRFQSQALALKHAKTILLNLAYSWTTLLRVYSANKSQFGHIRLADLDRLAVTGWRSIPVGVLDQIRVEGWHHTQAFVPPGSMLTQCLREVTAA